MKCLAVVFVLCCCSVWVVAGHEAYGDAGGGNGGTEEAQSYININRSSNVECVVDEDCYATYTPGIENLDYLNSSIVKYPYCQKSLASNQSFCSCGEYCLSRTLTCDSEELLYYCGPCGRAGSSCSSKCENSNGGCGLDGYCKCEKGGTFYEVYFCNVPFYGYQVAFQMSVSICIVIFICLLFASLYNAIGARRLHRINDLRQMFRGDSGVRESPPNDIPPKYEDVMQDLPTFQEAIIMSQTSEENLSRGIVNLGFEDESAVHISNQVEFQGEGGATALPSMPECPPYCENEDQSKINGHDIYKNRSYEDGTNFSQSIDIASDVEKSGIYLEPIARNDDVQERRPSLSNGDLSSETTNIYTISGNVQTKIETSNPSQESYIQPNSISAINEARRMASARKKTRRKRTSEEGLHQLKDFPLKETQPKSSSRDDIEINQQPPSTSDKTSVNEINGMTLTSLSQTSSTHESNV